MKLLALSSTILMVIQAQGWAARQDGSGDDRARAVAHDMQGNVYIVGQSTSPQLTAFDSLGLNVSSMSISGVGGAFLIKYTSTGSLVWMAKQDGGGDDIAWSLAIDLMGNVHVCGQYDSNPLIIYDARDVAAETLLNSGATSAYMVKYSSNGSVIWALRQDSTTHQQAYTVSTNSLGDVYVGGFFASTQPLMVYDAQDVNVRTLASFGFYCTYLIKYAGNGSYIWALKFDGQAGSGTSSVYGSSVDAQDNVLVAGYYQTIALQVYNAANLLVKQLTLSGPQGSYAIKLASNGSFIWAAKQDGASDDYGWSIATSSSLVNVVGYYQSSPLLIYDARDNLVKSLSGAVGYAAFTVTYSYNGSLIWAAKQDGNLLDRAFGNECDAQGNCYVGGYYQSTDFAVYDLYDTPVKHLPLSGSLGAYIVKYLWNGTLAWAARQDGAAADSLNRIAVDNSGNVYAVGYYSSSPLIVYDAVGQVVSNKSLLLQGTYSGYVLQYDQNGLWNTSSRVGSGPTTALSYTTGQQTQISLTTSTSSPSFQTSSQTRTSTSLSTTRSTLSSSTTSSSLLITNSAAPTSSSLNTQVFNSKTSSTTYLSTSLVFQVSTSISSSSINSQVFNLKISSTRSMGTTLVSQASTSLNRSTSSSVILSSSVSLNTHQASAITQSSTPSTAVMVIDTQIRASSSSSLAVSQQQLTTKDSNIELYYSQPVVTYYSSMLSLQDSVGAQQPVPTISINLFILLAAAGALLICLFVLLLVCCKRRKNRISKARDFMISESQTTTEMSQDTNMGTTMMVTSHVLAIPQFMMLQLGVDLRQLNEIARGGGGSINHCEVLDVKKFQHLGNTKLVIKNLGKDVYKLTDQIRRSFYQEISMMYMFRDQPYCAKMFGFTEQPATIVLKYYELGSLKQFIMGENDQASRFRYSKRQVLLIQCKLAQGLELMHSKQFAHNDIKPDNVLLEQVGLLLEPRITDFGISRLLDNKASQVQAFQLSQIRGASIRYGAPEVFIRFRQHKVQSDPEIWKAGDVYALSIVLLEMSTRSASWSLNSKK